MKRGRCNHGVAAVLIMAALAPLVASCDPRDILKTRSERSEEQRARSREKEWQEQGRAINDAINSSGISEMGNLSIDADVQFNRIKPSNSHETISENGSETR